MRALILTLILTVFATPAEAQLRPMVYSETTVGADVNTVWDDWTTAEGLESFFAPKAIVELEPGGAYEVWFLPDAPKGQRGADNGVVLGFQDKRMIQFTWAMPPYMPEIRPHMTVVQVWFVPVSETQTRVRLFHTGFGDGEIWDKGHDYFQDSWPQVLELYRKHIEGE